MQATSNSADWLQALLAILGYGLLFYRTIRQNRNNRPVVLGVWTIVMFGGFLAVITLERHPLLRGVVAIGTVLLGVGVLLLVGQDIVRWLRRDAQSDANASTERPNPDAVLK